MKAFDYTYFKKMKSPKGVSFMFIKIWEVKAAE